MKFFSWELLVILFVLLVAVRALGLMLRNKRVMATLGSEQGYVWIITQGFFPWDTSEFPINTNDQAAMSELLRLLNGFRWMKATEQVGPSPRQTAICAALQNLSPRQRQRVVPPSDAVLNAFQIRRTDDDQTVIDRDRDRRTRFDL